ncbi:MAG: flippase-like domain-containing protein [Cycloclasticus sp.]|nr:flippase-like domain-containing protein [Cycloclasticus sp.]
MGEQISESKVESPPKASTKRNWKGFVVRIVGSLLVLALLFSFLPRDKLVQALDAFSVELWMAGVACYLCLHLIGVAKWRMLINAAGGGLSFSQAVRCYYYGLFGNTFLPSVVGGDIIRAGLAFRLTHSKSAVVMGSLVDRTIDSLGLALVAGIGALLIPMSLDDGSRSIFWGFAAVLALAAVLLTVAILALPVRRLTLKWRRRLVKVRKSARLLIQRPYKVLVALLAVVVLQTSQVVMNCWLGRLALMANASFLTWLFIWPVAKLSAMAPLTQGGIGVREAVQGTLFVPFGVSMEKAVATGLMFQAIIICGNLLGGLLAMVLGRVSLKLPSSSHMNANVAYRWAVYGSFAMGLILFFVANTLMLALGSGSVGEQWTQWMACLPGYDISFAGSAVGLVYGLMFGYCLGWVGFHLMSRFNSTSNVKG